MKPLGAMTEKQNAGGPSEYPEDPIEGAQPGKQSLGQGWEKYQWTATLGTNWRSTGVRVCTWSPIIFLLAIVS